MKMILKKLLSFLNIKRRYVIPALLVLIILGAIAPYLYQFMLIEGFENWNEERETYSFPFNSSRLDLVRVNASPPRVLANGFPAPVTSPISSRLDPASLNTFAPSDSPYGFLAPVTSPLSSRLDPAVLNASAPIVSPNGFLAPMCSPLSSWSDPARFNASAPAVSPYGFPAPAVSPYGFPAPAVSPYGFPAPAVSPYGFPAPAVSPYGFPAPAVSPYDATAPVTSSWTFYNQAVILHSDHQDTIQGLLLLAIFTTSFFAVLPHLSKTNYSKEKKVLVVFIICVPFGNALFLIIGCLCTGVVLILVEGFQELYMNWSVVALGKLVLLNIRYPARLNRTKTRWLKFFIWQAIYIRSAGTVFQIVSDIIGYDFSSYELLFCLGYTISSIISGLAVYFLYKSGVPSNLPSGKSKMKFTKILDVVLLQDMYLRYIKFQHALKASIFMVEMLVTGIVLLKLFPVKKYAKKFRIVLKKVRIRPLQRLPV